MSWLLENKPLLPKDWYAVIDACMHVCLSVCDIVICTLSSLRFLLLFVACLHCKLSCSPVLFHCLFDRFAIALVSLSIYLHSSYPLKAAAAASASVSATSTPITVDLPDKKSSLKSE